MDDSRNTLIDEFFKLNVSDKKATDIFVVRLNKYLRKEPDAELPVISNTLNTLVANRKDKGFKICCSLATPVFEYLEETENYGRLELHILSMIIAYNEDYDKTCWFFQKANDRMNNKEYVDVNYINSIRTNLHYNMMTRVLSARLVNKKLDTKGLITLKTMFDRCYSHVIEVCERKNLHLKHLVKIRRALFEKNVSLVLSELKILKDVNKALYHRTRAEISGYFPHMYIELGTDLTNILIGYNIAKYRNKKGLKQEEFSAMVNKSQGEISSIENGENGLSASSILYIAHALEVKPGMLFGDCDTP